MLNHFIIYMYFLIYIYLCRVVVYIWGITRKSPRGTLARINFRVCSAAASCSSCSSCCSSSSFSYFLRVVPVCRNSPTAWLDAIRPFYVRMVLFRYLAWPPSRPPLQLGVWTGQRGQHGDGKEGRLCPARPPGRPEGKEAWRVLERRKRVSGKKNKKKIVNLQHPLLHESSSIVYSCFFSLSLNLLHYTAPFSLIFVFVTHFPF